MEPGCTLPRPPLPLLCRVSIELCDIPLYIKKDICIKDKCIDIWGLWKDFYIDNDEFTYFRHPFRVCKQPGWLHKYGSQARCGDRVQPARLCSQILQKHVESLHNYNCPLHEDFHSFLHVYLTNQVCIMHIIINHRKLLLCSYLFCIGIIGIHMYL